MTQRLWVIAACVAAAAGPAVAKPGTPGPHYFEGTYERIGRTGANPPVLISDQVVITPLGQEVVIHACSGADVQMSFGPAFEIVNLMTGGQAGVAVECLFHNNGYNRPILTCQSADGGGFTLWPLKAKALKCDG